MTPATPSLLTRQCSPVGCSLIHCNSTTKQNQPILNSSLNIALTLNQSWNFRTEWDVRGPCSTKHTVLKTGLINYLYLLGLITDPPPTSPTTCSKRKEKKKKMTPDTCHMTPAMWHLVGGEQSLKISALYFSRFGCNDVLMVWRKRLTQ